MDNDPTQIRQQRRHAERLARKKRSDVPHPPHGSSVYEHRVTRGRIALTFDLAGHNPSTFEVDEGALTGIFSSLDRLVADNSYSYPQVLRVAEAALSSSQAGNRDGDNACLIGFWIAFNHPQSGARMREMVSDAMAEANPIHITLHGAAGGGIAMGLADRFIDLEPMLAEAKTDGVGTWVATQPRRNRAGGRA
jgi:hypothetical protein